MGKKKIWLMNHYAIGMFFNKGGRHYWFADNLVDHGYEPTIFCANTRHKTSDVVKINAGKFTIDTSGRFPFVFVKTSPYSGNGFHRVRNMFSFYKNLFPAAREYARQNGRPDIILASSVHPLTLVAGIKIARKFGVPCICEIRDLWPESFVAYNIIGKNNPILKALYAGEKWIYKKADKLIFTMEGGRDYILEKGWDKEHGGPIDICKVYHINNGVDLETFDYNKEHFIWEDEDLKDSNTFKVAYTGSIRLVNKVEKVLAVAKLLEDQNIKFLIWGEGDQLEHLRKKVKRERIDNVSFKGRVDKKYIPYITTNAQLNIMLGENLPLFRFGGSMNKMFDYFASGKPTLFTFKMAHSPAEKYNTGIELDDSKTETIAESILYFKNLDRETYGKYCQNARKAAENYNFKHLTNSLIDILEA